jgi:hypothetical protein
LHVVQRNGDIGKILEKRDLAAADGEFSGEFFVQLSNGQPYEPLLLRIKQGKGHACQQDEYDNGDQDQPE